MKLTSVTISGFRSIKHMKIPFDGYGHKVLVGKNESGKSNILKALQLLSGGTFSKSQRKVLFDKNSEPSIIFEFQLGQDELAKCKDIFIEKFLVNSGTKLTTLGHTVDSFYSAYGKKILYVLDIEKESRWTHWAFPKTVQTISGWFCVTQKIADQCLNEYDIPVGSYIHDSFIQKTFSGEQSIALLNCLSTAEAADISDVLHDIILETLELQEAPLTSVYWEYSSKECDLPNVVPMDEFSKNPDSCQPLRNMFLLAGYQKNTIQEKIAEAKEEGHSDIKTLLDDVGEKTTLYIKKNWQEYNKEYGDVKIELWKDGEDIGIGVKDFKSTFKYNQRSDGFRRFVSFLLLMMNQTSNSLILLDEPETGLHHSSAKNLRDVLIKLGKKNIVVYATHSISMIDTQNIENNLVVIKEGEDTSFKLKKEDGTSSGELVYNAIGYSIYNELKKKNILLEGYEDKKVLKLSMQGPEWKDFGICYTDGVKNIGNIVPLLELADREYFILSDSDNVAKQYQTKHNFEHWYTYKDLGSDAVTLEDFYTREFFSDTTKSVLEKHKIDTKEFSLNKIAINDRLKFINAQLNKQGCTTVKKITDEIKFACANKVTKIKIDAKKMNPMLEELLKKIKEDATE